MRRVGEMKREIDSAADDAINALRVDSSRKSQSQVATLIPEFTANTALSRLFLLEVQCKTYFSHLYGGFIQSAPDMIHAETRKTLSASPGPHTIPCPADLQEDGRYRHILLARQAARESEGR